MRQTNNALNLLNASYQAVFKHSYVTGLASTVALLSISPYATAASFASNATDGAKTNYTQGAQVNTGLNKGSWYANNISITGGDKNNTSFTINGVSGDSKVYFNTGAKITNAFLNVSGSDTYEARLTGSFDTTSTPKISGEIEFNGSKLNISQGKVEVNTASFDTSEVVIQGKAGKNDVIPTDTLLNYSALRTGQAAKNNGQAGNTSFNNTDLTLGDYSALDAMGDVTFERGTIKITAAKDTNSTDYGHGELAAKAVIRAQELTLGSDQYGGNLHVGQNADGKAAGGAIYAARTTLNNGTITVDEGSSLQIAGQMSQVGVDGTTNLAEGSDRPQNINTNLYDGELTLNGTVVNNGELLLGGNSIVSSDKGTVSRYNASQYDVEQTGGTFNNNGTLRLGDALVAQGVTFDQTKGTSYTLSKGNFNNNGSIQITKNSKLQQTGGTFVNSNKIQADNGAAINIQNGTFKNAGTIALNSGSSFNINANAVYAKKLPYSVTQDENIAVADVNNLGKMDAESGSKIKLQNGMFKAELTTPNSLGANIANAIANGTKVGLGDWTISNATLQLANDLDLTSNKLASTNIRGEKGAVLATTGDLTFTSTSGGTGSMGGFDKLQGGDVTINRVSGDSYQNVWLKAPANTPKTIAATKSVTTDDGTPLAIGNNMTLELTTEQFNDVVTDITTADTRQPETHQVKVDLTVGSGGALNVAADHWTARNITTEQGSQLNITGTAKNSANNDFKTHAQLSAQNFNFNGAVNAEDEAVLTSTGDTTLNSHAYVQLTNSTLNTQNLKINGEGTGADTQQGALNLDNSTLSATQAINVDNGKLSGLGSKLLAQNFTLSNGAVISFTNSQVTVHDKLSTDSGSGVNELNLDNTQLKAEHINLNSSSTLTAVNGARVTTESLRNIGSKGIIIQADFNNSNLTITGDNNSKSTDLNVKLSMNGGSLNLGDALDTVGLRYEGSGFKTNGDFQQITANSTRVSMDLSNSNLASIDKELKQQLFEKMFDTNDSADAYLSLSGVTSSDITTSKDENGNIIVDFGDLTDENGDVNMDYDTDTTKEAILTKVDATKKISGGWRAIQTANDQLTSVNVDANKTLQIFGATDSNNLIENSAQQTVGIDLGDKSKLNLNSSGKIGDITGQGVITVAQGQKVEVVASTAANNDAAALSKLEGQQLDNYGDLNVDTVNANLVRLQSGSNLNASSVEAQKLYAVGAQASGDEFKVGYAKVEKSQIKAGNFTADDAVYVDLASSLDVSGTLKANKGLQIKGDATVTAANLYVAGGDLKVGTEATGNTSGSSAKLVANNLDLNGNNLILDPEFGQKTATAFIRSFADLDAATETTTGKAGEGTTTASTFKLNGNIVVGRNSALGLGGDESDFTAALAKLQDSNGSLKQDGIGALAYINQTQVELDGKKLVVGTEDVATLQERLQDKSAIYLGQNSGLQIGTKAMAEAVNSDKLIFSDLTSEDIINSNGGTLIVPSDMNKDKIAKIFGDQVKLSNGQTIKVQTENGAYVGVINSSDDLHGLGDFMLTANTNSRQILNQMSNPTYDFYTKVRDQGANQDTSNGQTADGSSTDKATLAATTLDNTAAYTNSTNGAVLAENGTGTEDPSTGSGTTGSENTGSKDPNNGGNITAGTDSGTGNNNTGAGSNNTSTNNDAYNYIIAAGSAGNGRDLEQAARLANLGVSVQIANQVANTTSDAIMQRVGMTHDRQTSNGMTVVDNSRSAVWFSPVYQSFDSDSFMANDLTYGADLKLYGVAAGFDHSFNNGLRVGAMVNIGKGDADGTGVATGISNDFKYYGAGLYASIQPMRDLVLSADVSYTAVNNDLEADTGMAEYGKLTTEADSSALSTGVNAQYRFNAAGLNVTPHVGMRYTRLSLDDYTVAVDGSNISSSSTDSMNIFSIPLGVGISTTLTNGNWLIRPNADFNITANFGDDNVNSTTRFTGMEDIKYSTEFMDSFTYGVKAGLQVQNGNFSLGTEVGYTKSSNTQEVSVGANARMLF